MSEFREIILTSPEHYNLDLNDKWKIILNSGVLSLLDNHSDLIISYAVEIDENKVLTQ